MQKGGFGTKKAVVEPWKARAIISSNNINNIKKGMVSSVGCYLERVLHLEVRVLPTVFESSVSWE